MATLSESPVHRVEIGQPEEFGQPSSKEEALPPPAEQRAGAKGAENAGKSSSPKVERLQGVTSR